MIGYSQKHGVANYLHKRSLLIAVNLVAGLSIFFFSLLGYDQGVMGGVNTTINYAEVMGFGYFDEATQIVKVTQPLLQGAIVGLHILQVLTPRSSRLLAGSGVLPAWYSCRCSLGRLDG